MTGLHAAGWPPPEPPDTGTHLCPVRRCPHQVPDGKLMCPGDWRRVPRPVQRAVLAAWAGGRGAGSAAHRAAMLAAVGAANRAVAGTRPGSAR